MICTFYSYKGGVGRSMALANVADVLSRRGLKVLMIDFDLEAPGLEQYFYRGDEREQRDAVRRQPGLLDLLLAYKEAMSVTGGGDDFREISRYIATIFGRRPQGGRLDLLPAGQRLTPEQLARYALALRSFDWQDFYFNWEGDLFFEWLRRALGKAGYDLVLIDSRTGVTEMGGICGYQLADVIVMMCGANHQNLDGTWSMLEDFRSQPVEGLRRGRPIEIVVVPARVEQRTPALLSEFFDRFDARFGDLLPPRLAEAGIGFRDLTIPYDPQFAFEERVARNPEEKAAKEHLAGIFSHLADIIVTLSPSDTPPESALGRVAADAATRLGNDGDDAGDAHLPAPEATTQARYDETKRFADFDILLSYSGQDAAHVTELRRALVERGVRAAVDTVQGAVSPDWKLRMEGMLAHARALAVCLGASGFESQQQKLVTLTLMARDAGRDIALLPVLLPGHEGKQPADPALAEFYTVDLRGGMAADALDDLVRILRRPHARPPAGGIDTATIETEERCPYIGPTAFAEHHADLFFGRDEEVGILTGLVADNSLVLLIGPSASGRTSLLRAGLFPSLRKSHPEWKLIDAPSAAATATAVARSLPTAQRPAGDASGAFAAIADRPRGSVVVAIDSLSRSAPLPAGTDESEMPPGAARGQRVAALVGELTALGARVVLTLRSDEIDEWMGAVKGGPLAAASRLELRPLAVASLRRMVEGPADRLGLAFEPGLVDRLMSRSENEPGVLPFLQLALCRLWEFRRSGWLTNAAYDSFGGLRGIVIETADRAFESRDEQEREAMRRIVLRLLQVAPGGTRATSHRARATALAAAGSAEAAAVTELVTQRLLVVGRDRNEATVELAHEALARDWPRVLIWLEQQRDFLEWLHMMQVEAEAWHAGGEADELLLRGTSLDDAVHLATRHRAELGHDVQRFIDASADHRDQIKARRVRVRSVLASVFLLIAVAAASGWFNSVRKGWALEQRAREISESHQVLEKQRNALLEQLKSLEGERNTAEAQRIEAEARLGGLQASLDEALASLRDHSGATADSAAAPLRRAVEEAKQVVQEQKTYVRKRTLEIDRQQGLIRDILTRQPTAPKAGN
ncbi:MAG: TIR domain-containing protein [Rhodocyclaceae bacterium]|nr:TIR domain-containing protein [Rhodocyclaceae bacterium]